MSFIHGIIRVFFMELCEFSLELTGRSVSRKVVFK